MKASIPYFRPSAITNRDFGLPEDDFYHLAHVGESLVPKPGVADPDPMNPEHWLIQVVDDLAMSNIIENFRADVAGAEREGREFPGLLVDYDHFSDDVDKSTGAGGWTFDLVRRADGLYAHNRWSEDGARDVRGGNFRFLSPTWTYVETGEDIEGIQKVRPFHMTKSALTNDPHFRKLRPLSNRETKSAKAADATQGGSGMDERLTALLGFVGLAADSTLDQVNQAITNAQPKLDGYDQAKAQLDQLTQDHDTLANRHKALLEEQADTDLATYAEVIENRDEVRKGLIENHDFTIGVLKSLKKRQPAKPPLHNRKGAATPDGDTVLSGKDAKAEQRAAAIRNRALQIQQSTPGLPFKQAFRQAEAEVSHTE